MSQAEAAPIMRAYNFAPDMSAGFIAAVSPSATDSTDSFSSGCASPTRRGMLAGLLLAPVVAAGSPPSVAASPSKWKEVLARYRAGHAEWDRFLQEVYNPAVDELERRAPAPPYSFTVTARNGKVLEYMHDRNNPDQWKYCVSPSIKAKGEALAAAWRKWRVEHDAIRQEIGFSAIEEEDGRRSKKIDALRDELIATRVGSPAEMLEKLELIWGEYDDVEPHKNELFRDFRALAGVMI